MMIKIVKKIRYKVLIFLLSLFLFTSCNFSFVVKPDREIDFITVRSNDGYYDLPSRGNSKMLVIPIVFDDCVLTDNELEQYHDKIEKAFFGTANETYWESVNSFYAKSSYNALNITGTVTDYVYFPSTIYNAYKTGLRYSEPSYYVLEYSILEVEKKLGNLNEYDSNKDGKIDSIWLIYMDKFNVNYFKDHPEVSKSEGFNTFLWAFTFWYTKSINMNHKSPKPFSYAWGSYQFLEESGIDNIDSHTYIHETGHLLGLDDYYNYDYSPGFGLKDRTKPTGCLDMMDNNILDHNAYSKYLLGWIEPEYILNSGTYSLNSFQDEACAFIIPFNNDIKHKLSEYLIIEYYTPTKLNKLDSEKPYSETIPQGFTETGFKIYHVDSRIAKYKYENNMMIFDDYLDNPNQFNNYISTNHMSIGNSNTPSRSCVRSNRLISLISSLGKSRLYFSGNLSIHAENKDLFQKDDVLNDFEFHQGKKQFSLKILESNENSGKFEISF